MNYMQLNNFENNNISLNREEHIYSLNDDPNIDFTSVTTFISDFFEKFDSLKIATKLVSKIPKYSHLTVNELLEQWKEARDHGTLVHNEIEEYLLENKEPKDGKSKNAIKWLNKHVYQEKHTLYSEKIIYTKELSLAGSVDLIIHNNETNEYTIIDWKTNAKIPTNSYNGKVGTHPITQDIEDCKYSLYALQLSLYRYILENYYGLNISRQLIVHLKDNEVLAYLTPYYNKHVDEFAKLRMS